MIELLKVYETLYLNDQQKILFKLIIKSKFSNNFFKSVRQAYLELIFKNLKDLMDLKDLKDLMPKLRDF